MPSICCASRCFNTSNLGYALVRFPKEEIYRKAWSDAVGENVSQRSLDNLRLCEVHFEPSDILVVGGRKEIKKSAIPSRFCNCPVDDIQDCKKLQELGKRKKKEIHMRNVKPRLEALENSSIYTEHSYNKSQLRKQKEEESDVCNIKARFYSNICQAVDTSDHISSRNLSCTRINTIKSTTKLSKKQVCAMNHQSNCPFTTLPLLINKNTKKRFVEKNCWNISNSEDICLSSNVNSIKRTVRRLRKENKMLINVKNAMELILQNKLKFQ